MVENGSVEIRVYNDYYIVNAHRFTTEEEKADMRRNRIVNPPLCLDLKEHYFFIEPPIKDHYPIYVGEESRKGYEKKLIDIAHNLDEAVEIAQRHVIDYADAISKANNITFENDPRKGNPLERINVRAPKPENFLDVTLR